VRRIAIALIASLALAGCGSSDHSASKTKTHTSADAKTSTGAATTTTTSTVAHVRKSRTAAPPTNQTITPADRAELLAVANEWKQTHQDGWGDGTTYAKEQLTGPTKGSVFDARWGSREYVYADFDLPRYEAESAILFQREHPDDDWQVVRLDTNTDIGGACGLPTPLVLLWYPGIAAHDGCAPMADPRTTVTDEALAADPFLLTSTDRTVTCLFETAANGTQTATCANDVDGSGLRLTGTGTDPEADQRSSQRLWDMFFADNGHARGADLGLDEQRQVGRFTCTSPEGIALECSNDRGGRIHVDGGV
jgi:hypothetical protein